MSNLLYIIIIVLLILWALGYFGGFVHGDLVHILLVVALILIVLKLIQGTRL